MKTKIPTKKDFSCGGLVWDPVEKKLLVVQVENLSKSRVWTFPKGHPEKDESDEEAALREVLEETGWTCEIEQSLMDVEYFYVHDQVRYHKTVRWFLMKPVEKTGVFNTDVIVACKWADLDETKKLISYDTDRELLKKLPL